MYFQFVACPPPRVSAAAPATQAASFGTASGPSQCIRACAPRRRHDEASLSPVPWRSFFAEVDAHLAEDVQLHCCGGFVATQLYGVARTTSDVDYLGIVPNVRSDLTEIGGKGSALHKKHKVYLDAVTIATPPENYEERLVPMFPGAWDRLRLFALEAHDLALSKLERNIERDRDDVQQLARAGHLKPEILRERYYSELRPNLMAHEARHDLTLRLWLESYWPA